jgi:capsular polysaccharide transport system permease protein
MGINSTTDSLGSFTGLIGSSYANSDSYLVVKFLKSKNLISNLENNFPIEEHYSDKNVDMFSRMRRGMSLEKKYKYWRRFIKTDYNPSSGIINFKVYAFDTKSAKKIADLVVEEIKDLTDRISISAREDLVKYAQEELNHSEDKLINARNALRDFRMQTNSFDLVSMVSSQGTLIMNLEQELVGLYSRISVLEQFLNHEAPSLKALKTRADAVEKQIITKKGGLEITGFNDEVADIIIKQDELVAQIKILEKAYEASQLTLEKARVDAGRSQKYLAFYVNPILPQESSYPDRIFLSFGLFMILLICWTSILIFYSALKDQIIVGNYFKS